MQKQKHSEHLVISIWSLSGGPVPLVTVVLDNSTAAQPNGDVSKIWAQIESDLNDAIAVLPVKSKQTSTTHFSKGAAQALLGKVFLFEKKYAQATSQFSAVIISNEYGLISDYSTVLRESTDFGVESVLEPNFVKRCCQRLYSGTNGKYYDRMESRQNEYIPGYGV